MCRRAPSVRGRKSGRRSRECFRSGSRLPRRGTMESFLALSPPRLCNAARPCETHSATFLPKWTLQGACGWQTARPPGSAFALDELYLVAVRILDESNHRRPMLHGSGLARDPAAALPDFLASLVGVVDGDRDMTVAVAHVVFRGVPVVGKLDYRFIGLVAVSDKGKGE